jgi:hypothetical protein
MNEEFGFSQEPTRNEEVAVGTSNTIVSENRLLQQPRKNITIRNTSSNAADIITVNLGYNEAAAGAGIVLKQNESFTDSSETGYKCYQGVITAICATANGKLAVYER